MLVIPARTARSSRDKADRLVIDSLDQMRFAVPPGSDAGMLGPRVGVALAAEAYQDRCRGVSVRLGIAAVLMLGDPEVEGVARHEGLDTAITGRAAVIEGQIAVDDIRNEVGPPHGEPAHRVRLDVVAVFVEIVGTAEAVAKYIGAVEDRPHIIDEVDEVRRRGAAQ